MPSGLFYLNTLDWSIPNRRVVWVIFIFTIFIEIPVSNAKRVDPYQTPRFPASDLRLHCLPISLLWDAWHKWVNTLPYLTYKFNKYVTIYMSKKLLDEWQTV